ncbi:hypothetical protein HF690_05160 [Oleiagrimonas citrea]|uniref:Uncharacterized protein n=1 Tax=Oleiagrimonas citrea TaxID=1665687 RepID=A0A846ZJ83_9GAMM|nr:hypothetical protein [Oleiagrimonas citrea]NKZ38345.1 hypothetical protein [Oleiagrimonas citrea]
MVYIPGHPGRITERKKIKLFSQMGLTYYFGGLSVYIPKPENKGKEMKQIQKHQYARLTVCVSAPVRAAIIKKAASAGQSVSEYLRGVLAQQTEKKKH